MWRFLSRLVIVFLAVGALASAVASATPVHQAVAASTTTTLLASASLRAGSRPRPDLGELPATPASTPTAMTPSTPAQPRPAATLRPIPIPAIDAQELALVNLDTGRLLWQRNARAAWAPASLTKIFTAMVASDLMGMNTMLTVPASISQLPLDSTVMGLTAGERLTVRDLLYGVFLDSGNDAAETLASGVTSRSTFIADMNLRALRLGLRTTHFVNPTGLDAPGHYSTADDLAVAATYLESHYPGLVAIAATPAIAIPATPTHKAYALINLDKLLHTYPGTYGLKTGWTDAALGCLITTSSRGGHRLLAVLLGAPAGTAYDQMPRVLDYGFELLGVLPRPS